MPDFNLVTPLATSSPVTTDMRTTDTTGQLDLFSHPARSGAVAPLTGDFGPRRGDMDSVNDAERRQQRLCLDSELRQRQPEQRSQVEFLPGRPRPQIEPPTPPADFSFDLLVQAYLDCRRNKRTKPSARDFEIGQEANLWHLYAALRDGTYQPGRSICFVITRPKPREVWAAPFTDRIVHHLLYNKVAPRFHAGFIADSCACIPERGTMYAGGRLEAKIRSVTHNWARPAWYLKCDLANFFVSIDKQVLFRLLARRISEPWWLAIAGAILFHDPRPDVRLQSRPAALALVPPHKSLMNQPAGFGLPIGNLSSQFFANVLLDALDKHVKHQLRARHYIRYVDDFLILHESKAQLLAWRDEITAWLPRELNLRLNPAKTLLHQIDRGVDFVGHWIKPWYHTTRRRTLRSALQRLASADAGDVHTTANSYFGMLRQVPHGHRDRARLANLVRDRGHAVDGALTKTYRRYP